MITEKEKIIHFLNKRLGSLILMNKYFKDLSLSNINEKELIQAILVDLNNNEDYKLTSKTVITKSGKVVCKIIK